MFTPKDVVFSGDSVFQVAYILLAAIFVMLLALTYNMSNRLYRPFRSIVDVLRDLQTPNETEEHELEKVRDKILDIVSLNHTLRSAIRDNSSVMLEAILLRLICAGPYAGEPFSSSDLYGIQFEEGRYNIFVVRMDLQFASEEQFYMKYYDAFCNILEQCLAECLVAQVSTRTDEYAVLVYCRDDATERIVDSLRGVYEALLQSIPQSQFYIRCGGWTEDILNLRACYEQAIAAIRRRSVNGLFDVMSVQSGIMKRRVHIPNELELELSKQLFNGRREQAVHYIQNLLERHRKENVSIEDDLLVCNSVNSFVLRYAAFHTFARASC